MGLWPAPPAACAPVMVHVAGGVGAPFGYLMNACPATVGDLGLAAGTVVMAPVMLPEPTLVQKGWWRNGSAGLTGSVQIGVYSDELALLAASAGVVQAGVSVLQEAAVSPAVLVPRGLVYLALATSAAGVLTAYSSFGGSGTIALQLAKATGMLLASPAYPLPDSIASATIVSTAGVMPHFGLSARALVV